MRVRNLDTFYWIASLGSFRAAAEKLNLTQPAVSARIQVLEQDLGTEVFEREVRNAELTSDGRRLLAYAERLMNLEQDVLAAFATTANVRQTIRLGASETIVSTWLPDFMGHLNQSRPHLSFDLRVDSTDNLRNALVAREVDLALLMGPVAEVSVTNCELCAYEMIFAASRDIAGLHAEWTLDDIAGQSVLTFASNTKPSRQIRELLVQNSSQLPDMTTSTSLGALIRLAKSGMGICAVPRAVIEAELTAGELVPLATQVRLPEIAFTASYVSGSPANKLMNDICESAVAFIDDRLIENIYQV
ncbi:MAG: LysR family transcriptional regulator [Pseudomonadota bacterium]